MENLNGRRLVEDGDLCERRNGNAAGLLHYMVIQGLMPEFVFYGRERC